MLIWLLLWCEGANTGSATTAFCLIMTTAFSKAELDIKLYFFAVQGQVSAEAWGIYLKHWESAIIVQFKVHCMLFCRRIGGLETCLDVVLAFMWIQAAKHCWNATSVFAAVTHLLPVMANLKIERLSEGKGKAHYLVEGKLFYRGYGKSRRNSCIHTKCQCPGKQN